ncbi:MAG: Fic family protein [Gammaproteobacteria bacterium]|nr:Fic family protein [Gammaproteobacteria bacterium]
MATPSDKLADSLEVLRNLQKERVPAIRSADLSRTHRERLVRNGFLKEVVKGWYISTRPDEIEGESTAWYAGYWQFCAAYLNHWKNEDWCLTPEQSVALHAENWTIPRQLAVRATKATNNVTPLTHGTALLVMRSSLPRSDRVIERNGMRIFSLPAALIGSGKQLFRQSPADARVALAMIGNASEILEQLLEGGHTIITGRLAGAFRNIGRPRIADEILQTMRAAGFNVRETDPFETNSTVSFTRREQSPYVTRIQMLWQDMRAEVAKSFPAPPRQFVDAEAYMRNVGQAYVNDAYSSLSIEGYQVTPELIDRVRSGDWNPAQFESDKESVDALAARGYWQAFQAVCSSVEKILAGQNAGQVIDHDHGDWYREMFAPGVAVGIHKPADLAGYRNGPVYIRRSRHVPPSKGAVRDVMPALFDLLKQETDAAVRAVLGHFVFVYIHPYMDGNGRMGRFLMNAMLASGGYPWTIVPLEKRNVYMAALEEASVNKNIKPFSKLLGSLVKMPTSKSESI